MSRRDQKGMASLVVSIILIGLLSAIAVSFAVLMNREIHKAVENQLGQTAYDAAASGINDAISYVRDNPSTNITGCQDLIGPGKPLNTAANISGDNNVSYTCALINTQPHELDYQSITNDQSQVIRVSVAGPTGNGDIMTSLMLSWQASNRTYNNFPALAQFGQLFDETTWKSSHYAPMMRLSLYPVPADTKQLNIPSSTYFFYPTAAPPGSSVTSLPISTGSGLQKVLCGNGAKNTNGFNDPADYDCNVILTGLPTSDINGYQYYIRMTPFYSDADIKLKGNDSANQQISFVGTQAVIDVTAKASSAVKRLQARVDISGLNGNSQDVTPNEDNLPEFTVRQPVTICKRLTVPTQNNVPIYIDDQSFASCGLPPPPIPQLKPPVISNVSCTATGYTTATCTGTVDPNNGIISDSNGCKWTLSDGQSSSCPGTGGNPSSTPYNTTWSISGLSQSTTYTATLCATNQIGGQGCGSASFPTPTPPPPPPPIAQSITVQLGWSATISGYGPGLNNCDFFNGGTPDSPGAWLASWYPVDTSYADNHSYGSSNYAQPAGTGLIHCKGISGADGWSGVPPAPKNYINITYFIIQGPYDNGKNQTGRYCPDYNTQHRYQDCVNWAIETNVSINCTAYFYPNTGGSTNSPTEYGSGGWTVGSAYLAFLYGSAKMTCNGGGVSTTVGTSSPGPTSSCYNQQCSNGWWYTTSNCWYWASCLPN